MTGAGGRSTNQKSFSLSLATLPFPMRIVSARLGHQMGSAREILRRQRRIGDISIKA